MVIDKIMYQGCRCSIQLLNPFPSKPLFFRVCSASLLNEQFLLFPQCFVPFWRTICHFHYYNNCRLQTLSVWKSLKFVVWERVNHYLPMPHFDILKIYSHRKHCEKRRNYNKQFLLFSQCFLPYMANTFYFKHTLKCLQFVSIWTSVKFCRLVMG